MKTTITILALALAFCSEAQENIAPELVSSGGGNAELTSLKVTYSIGEPIIGLTANSNIKLSQGFHQTNLSITSIEELEELGIRIFPNPTQSVLTIEWADDKHQGVEIQLHDNRGRQVFNLTNTRSNRVDLDVSEFSNGIYALTIIDGEIKLGTYKIIKQ